MQSNANARVSGSSSHVDGVNATSGGLVAATLGAAIVAGAILTFVWLPAEHGIDPTGVGHVLGLTEMGEIKEQLHTEADADAAANNASNTAASKGASTAPENSEIISRLDAIDTRLAAIEASVGVTSQATNTAAVAVPTTQSGIFKADSSAKRIRSWRHEVSYTLEPGKSVEVKLVMNEGASADFAWTANGAVLNHDTHGDGDGQNISYEKGRAVPEQAGRLVAAFTGSHGWFWRNRTDDDVVVTLRTRGDYSKLFWP